MADFVCTRFDNGHWFGSSECPMCHPNISPLYRRLLKMLRGTFVRNNVEPRSAIEIAARQQLDAIWPEIERAEKKYRKRTQAAEEEAWERIKAAETRSALLREEVCDLLLKIKGYHDSEGYPAPGWVTERLEEIYNEVITEEGTS